MLGNACNKGGSMVTMALERLWPKAQVEGLAAGEMPVECRVTDKGDGTYALDYKCTRSGSYPIAVMVDDEHVQGSPLRLGVKPAEPEVERFHLSGAGLSTAQVRGRGSVGVGGVGSVANAHLPLLSPAQEQPTPPPRVPTAPLLPPRIPPKTPRARARGAAREISTPAPTSTSTSAVRVSV